MAEIAGSERIRPTGPESAHWLAEIEKRAFRDRNRCLGDPAFRGVDARALHRPGAAEGARRVDQPRPRHADRRSSPSLPGEKPTTTHFSVIDGDGMAVSVTTTLNDSFGNARVAPGLGFLWNNEMDDFATRPGEPNMYGLIQGEVNAVAPGKRMLSAMCPSIAIVRRQRSSSSGARPAARRSRRRTSRCSLGLAPASASPRGGGRGAALPPAGPARRDPDRARAFRRRLDRRAPARWATRSRSAGRIGSVHAIAVEPDGTLNRRRRSARLRRGPRRPGDAR